MTGSQFRSLGWLPPILVLLLLYAMVRVAVEIFVPWQMAFDDFFYIPETRRWMAAGGLGDDGVFRRVPLWNLILGAYFTLFGVRGGILVLQAWVVAAATALGVWAVRSGRSDPSIAGYVPLLAFILSPQIVLYARQAVNELFIGLLVMGVMALGSRPTVRRAVYMGALVGLAAMTKLVAVLAGVVAAGYLVAERKRLPLRASLPGLAAGFLAVSVPLALFAMVSRDSLLLDNTAAYALGGVALDEWKALADPVVRYQEGMARFRQTFTADPWGYLAGASERLFRWVTHPSSAELAYFYRGYPQALIEGLDRGVALILMTLAAFGTRRADLGVWIFFAGIVVACSFPQLTASSPKVILLFPALMLAPAGLARLRRLRHRLGADEPPAASQPSS